MATNEQLNNQVREIFTRAIQDGHKKNHVCALTLGNQCVPQFDGFVKGRDFGIKPMERALGAFDYEIHLVPVAKTDHKALATIDGMTNDCMDNVTTLLLSSLDKETLRSAASKKSPMFIDKASDILSEIGYKPEVEKAI